MRQVKLLIVFTIIFLSSISDADTNKIFVTVDNVPIVTSNKPETYPQNIILGSFGKSVTVEYAIAFAEEELIFYAFVTNNTDEIIPLNLAINVFNEGNMRIGVGGDYLLEIKPKVKRQMIGIPMYKDKVKLVHLYRVDISGPIKLEVLLKDN